MNLHRSIVLLCGVATLGLSACSSGCAPATSVERPADPTPTPTTTEAAAVEPTPAPPAPPHPLAALRQRERVWFDMVRLSHFADRSVDGSLRADMGTIAARKYILGGWRSGWNPTPRQRDGVDYFEADSDTVRFFFTQKAGGYDRITARMKAVVRSNSAAVFVNGKPLGRVKLGPTWQDFTFEVPAEATRDGENELMLKFSASIREEGRAQVAHIDTIDVLALGAASPALPSGAATGRVALGGEAREVVLARQPQSFTWRVQLPQAAPQLGLAIGAAAEGAHVTVKVRGDGRDEWIALDADAPADAWRELVLPLEDRAGEVVEIEVQASGAVDGSRWVGWEAAVYAPAPALAAPRAPEIPAKNVLIYLIDTLRHDKIGAYNPKSSVPTPNLDAFANDALLYEAAYDAENWTKPSTASILTGLYPWTHGTKDGESKLPASVDLVSEHLQGQGFRTGSFIANGYVSNSFGFDQGWHYYTNYIRESKSTDAEKLVDDALGWIDKQGDKRWFAYVHTIDPHVPYSAPGEWKLKMWNQLNRGKYKGAIRPQSTGDQLAEIKSGKMKLDENDRLYLEALYDSEVAYNDHEFGRLIEGLKARGVYEDTVIVMLVDHGEEFWDHGSVGHGHSVYDEMVHSPLIIRYPNRVPTGARLPHVVSTTAVVPTVLELLGAAPMKDRDGESLVDTFDGVGAGRPRVGVSDFMYRFKGIRAGRYHWLTHGVGGSLYDLATDRHETKDLAATHPIARAFVRGDFGMFMGAGDQTRWWEDAHREVVRVQHAERAEVDGELADQLKAMGYVEGATSERSAEQDRELMLKEDGKKAP